MVAAGDGCSEAPLEGRLGGGGGGGVGERRRDGMEGGERKVESGADET